MRRILVPVVLSAAAISAATWIQAERAVWINGTQVKTGAILRDGDMYVSVRALRDAGAEVSVTAGRVSIQFIPVKGQVQKDGATGTVGEYVSNGHWRVKVHEVSETTNPFVGKGKGFAVTLELRNLNSRPVSPHNTGMSVQLVDSNGKALSFSSRSFPDLYTRVPSAGVVKNTLVFGDSSSGDSEVGEADKLLIQFRGTNAVRPSPIRIQLRNSER